MAKRISIVIINLFILSACSVVVPTYTPTPSFTRAPQPTSTFTPTFTPTITLTPTPMGGSGNLLFIFSRKNGWGEGFEESYPNLLGDANVFTSKWDGSEIQPITTTGINGEMISIESISPDGTKFLVSSFKQFGWSNVNTGNFGELYLIDLKSENPEPIKLAKRIYKNKFPAAIWLDNLMIAYMALYGGEYSILTTNIDGKESTLVTSTIDRGKPIRLLYGNRKEIYWVEHATYERKVPHIWRSKIDGTEHVKLEIENFYTYWDRYSVSPDGKWLVWHNLEESMPVYVASLGESTKITSRFIGKIPGAWYQFLFSYDSSTALIIPTYGGRYDYENAPFSKAPISRIHLDTGTLKELFVPDYSRADLWEGLLGGCLSPDGRIFFVLDGTYERKILVINLEAETYSSFNAAGLNSVFCPPP